ncbi:MAG: glycosyltransferase family 2 protein [Bacteroidales bacterium]|jgi:cellulose synthase/poly-beta-1,6-N-acetylglucosamine synthase-like glycosyltransferase|nr:glycosyltransferase family 2 protein [Bacteroidales bacterium]
MMFLKTIFYIITAYFTFCALYVFLYAVAGLFYKNPVLRKAKKNRKFAVLVPAYKADEVIEELADNVLLQDYPDFEIIIIADSMREEVLQRLRTKPLSVMEFSAPNRTKALALNTAMEQLPDDRYDIALILDTDNLIRDGNYLSRLNDAFDAGWQAVQTHRTAKNTDTTLALLDAVSEEINNSLFRRGHTALGMSSAIIGSAMAFDYRLYKSLMRTVTSSGEDKELEIKLLRQRVYIAYLDDVIVWDEKTRRAGAFVNQRARWLANQILQAKQNAAEGIRQLFRGNLDFFDKALQLFLLPRVLLLGASTLLAVAALFFLPLQYSGAWLIILLLVYSGILIAIPQRFYTIRLLKSLSYLPVAVALMVLSLCRIKDATKKFIATEHKK